MKRPLTFIALLAAALLGSSCASPDLSDTVCTKKVFEEQYALNKAEWDAAFEFMARKDLDTLAAGRYQLTERTYAKVSTIKTREQGKFEAHRLVADVFYVVSGEEKIGVSKYEDLQNLVRPYDRRDAELYETSSNPSYVTLTPGKSAIFFPEEGHQPNMAVSGPSEVKLVVIKVPCGRKSLNVIPEPNNVTFKKGVSAAKIEEASVSYRDGMPSEGYELTVGPKKISIVAGGESGAFYARQTLLQMQASYGEGQLPCCVVKDAPRFAWRGFMLDESRHFRGSEYVKKTLDMMAYYKLNKFHWHLTDAQGWRLEIDAFPKLIEIGAVGNNTDPKAPGTYYTKAQVREIIEYAAALNIEVIPEIDMPGHATAANHAYPFLSGGSNHNRFPDFTFNVGSEKTYEFLETVLKEVAELFPSEYIHIGADEVSFGNSVWNDNKDIQALIEREKLDGLKGAEGYFVKRMAEFVRSLGKKPILWDDALDVGIGNDAAIMWWRHDVQDHLRKAVAEGYPVIMSPRLPCYFDYVQAENHTEGPKRVGRWNDQAQMYLFPDLQNSIGDSHTKEAWGLTPEQLSSVMGMQANLWCERIVEADRADFMTWPRLCALAEAAWSRPEVKNYADFLSRMDEAFKYLDSRGVYYYDFRDPSRTPEPAQPDMYK